MTFIKKFYTEYKLPILIFLIWRLGLFALGFLAINILPFKASFPYVPEVLIPSGFNQAIWQWGNFDGVHYLTIASLGYSGDVASEQVFFPVFPIMIWVLTFLTKNYVLSGLILSTVFSLIVGLALYKLVKKTFDEKIAIWSVLFLYAFPTSFFFGSIYTEAIFLSFILLAFLKDGIIGFIFSFLAGGTRLVGGFLGVAAFFKPKKFVLLASFLGVLAYMIYLGATFNDPFKFISAQSSFKNERATSFTRVVTPPQVAYRYFKIFKTTSPQNYDFWLSMLEFWSFIGGTVVLIYLYFKSKIPKPWIIFSLGSLILPAFSGTFSSVPRYLLVCFPIYIFLGSIKTKWIRSSLLVIFLVFEAIFTCLFLRGYFVA